MAILEIKSGDYIFGIEYTTSNNQKQHHELGILRVFPFESGSPKTGQWHVQFNTTDQQPIKEVIISIAARLGLLPVHFIEEFKQALLSPRPLCLVADTSSLHHGSLVQACRLRKGKPTHLVIPDQVYMEIQRQRERYSSRQNKPEHDSVIATATSHQVPQTTTTALFNSMQVSTVRSLTGKIDQQDDTHWSEWLKARRSQSMQVAAARSVRRLKELGMIPHYIRPPDAMVRYFGSASGTGEQTEPSFKDGPNYHRDRLILEAARVQRMLLPTVPVWLVTGDANLAIQAKLEDFQVGYSWLPKFQPASQVILTSPYFEPYTLTPQFLTIEEFLEEWLWHWETIMLQRSGKGERTIWELPPRQSRERVQLQLSQPSSNLIKSTTSKCPRRQIGGVFNQVSDNNSSKVSVPARAPTVSNLLQGLQRLAGIDTVDAHKPIAPEVVSYLCGLKWARKTDSLKITERGRNLAERWNQLTADMVVEWYDWIYDASQDLLSLLPQPKILDALLLSKSLLPQPKILDALLLSKWQGDNELADQINESERNIESQSRLANAFGLIVRLNGKSYKTEWKTPQEAADLIFDTATQLQQQISHSSAVPVGKVFTHLLTTEGALSLPDFRRGLFELYTTKRIILSGTVPDKNSVKIKVLVPHHQTELLEVNLGVGDFLIPNQPSQVIILEK